MTEAEFVKRFGREPALDELHRVNCPRAGEVGHWLCGMCDEHNGMRSECGCQAKKRAQ